MKPLLMATAGAQQSPYIRLGLVIALRTGKRMGEIEIAVGPSQFRPQ